MGTRSRIAIKNTDGSYDSVYCHFDGYIDGVGFVLYKYYENEDKVRRMIAGGNMSTLGKYPEACGYYSLDGEPRQILHSPDLAGLIAEYNESWCEFLYLYEDGTWKVKQLKETFKPLASYFKEDAVAEEQPEPAQETPDPLSSYAGKAFKRENGYFLITRVLHRYAAAGLVFGDISGTESNPQIAELHIREALIPIYIADPNKPYDFWDHDAKQKSMLEGAEEITKEEFFEALEKEYRILVEVFK